ncbi:zinc-binding alcohol dehydrogenase [Acuticoccus sp. MNP-M23]|uniref:zinc-dependent alcohol dehydrogenase n=1 Tax=Acuticoccus sp. MNP-M23 TaxID=3072793 RepID=UPI0028157CD8|nr:zinc-binding alcohol dehydrogenase [Acuticoccus sp. MNP-M23]WMS44104.1 zinc-binding alcohol dehydrogenase [Acuticoccus sp. MNP-M23]
MNGPATALWCEKHGTYGLRNERIDTADHDIVVETAFSAVSKGTERLVLAGEIPASEFSRMRCPAQAGEFPFPVKYGYAAVGRIVSGPEARLGGRVFALQPHQSMFALKAEEAIAVPDNVPSERAALAANMETALNVVWDSGAAPCDNVVVVGCGVVGLLIARLLARTPGVVVTAVDTDASKRKAAEAMGAAFALPADAPEGADIAINASGRSEGLVCALASAGREARVVEASWHGTREAHLPLGGAFHSQRLSIVSSQVGSLPPARAPRWTYKRRLTAALSLLDDPALDALLTHRVPLAEAPDRLPALLADPGALAILLTY